MEPIVIILLLFGAFTLGAELGGSPEAKTSESISEPQPEKPVGRGVHLSMEACYANRQSLIYRDLTLPVSSKPITKLLPHHATTETADD
mgnify:CR=1 FL=1